MSEDDGEELVSQLVLWAQSSTREYIRAKNEM